MVTIIKTTYLTTTKMKLDLYSKFSHANLYIDKSKYMQYIYINKLTSIRVNHSNN